MTEEVFNLILPISRDECERSKPQRWFLKQQHDNRAVYVPGDWQVNGEVFIYTKDGAIVHRNNAEIRFGEHHYMQSFKLCLAVSFQEDDKHEIQFPRADLSSQTITGSIHNVTFVFRVYPFQHDRLKRLRRLHDFEGLNRNFFVQ